MLRRGAGHIVLPAVLLADGREFPTAIGVLIAVVAFVLGCSALLKMQFAPLPLQTGDLGLYLLLQIPLVMCCSVLYLLKFPTFYSLPIALVWRSQCGIATSG